MKKKGYFCQIKIFLKILIPVKFGAVFMMS